KTPCLERGRGIAKTANGLRPKLPIPLQPEFELCCLSSERLDARRIAQLFGKFSQPAPELRGPGRVRVPCGGGSGLLGPVVRAKTRLPGSGGRFWRRLQKCPNQNCPAGEHEGAECHGEADALHLGPRARRLSNRASGLEFLDVEGRLEHL